MKQKVSGQSTYKVESCDSFLLKFTLTMVP